MTGLILHGYWRSGAAWRVRIALNLKGLPFAQTAVDLRRGDQHAPAFRSASPQGLVPALDTGEGVLTQSGAIIEWLEERWPQPPLLPASAHDRAIVRSMAALVACDIHPLNNLRVQRFLREEMAATPDEVSLWISRWIGDGFAALETLIARHGGQFAFADQPGLADCFLIPQVYSARRFGVPLGDFPLIVGVDARASALPAFAAAAADAQPDAPTANN